MPRVRRGLISACQSVQLQGTGHRSGAAWQLLTSASSFLQGCHMRCRLGCTCPAIASCFLKASVCCRKKDDEVDPEQIRRDMERLKLLKDKRCCLCAASCCMTCTA